MKVGTRIVNLNFGRTGGIARLTSLVFAFSLVGCNGGLIGTSTGPSDNTTQIVILPSKVAPRIPNSLIEELPGRRSGKNQYSLASSDAGSSLLSNTAYSWQTLSPIFTRAELARIGIELELKLLNSVSDSISDRCGSLNLEPCVFSAGELKARLTQEMIDSFDNIKNEAASARFQLNLNQLMTQEDVFVGDQVDIGNVSFSRLNDDIYTYRLAVDELTLLSNQAVQLDWSSDFADIRYSVQTDGIEQTASFHYQTLPDAQRLALNSSLDNSIASGVVALELTAGVDSSTELALFNVNVAGDTVAGQAVDSAAYTLFFDYGDESSEAVYLQEKFGVNGEISDVASCTFESFQAACLSSDLLDSRVSFSGDDFESAISEFGFAEVTVSNLPENVGRFEIRGSTNVEQGDSPSIYCDVWQPPAVLYETEICYEDPEIVQQGVVFAIDADGNEFIVDAAQIEIVKDAFAPSDSDLIESSIRGEKYAGTYALACTVDDFDPEELLYFISTAIFTEDTLILKDEYFLDASCSIPATPAEIVSTADLYYPGGIQQTALGDADFINVSVTGFTEDGMPLSTEDQELIKAAGFFDLVIYSVILLDGNTLRVADITDGEVGLSASLRSTTLDTLLGTRQ